MCVHIYQHRALLISAHADVEDVVNVLKGKDVGHIIDVTEKCKRQ